VFVELVQMLVWAKLELKVFWLRS